MFDIVAKVLRLPPLATFVAAVCSKTHQAADGGVKLFNDFSVLRDKWLGNLDSNQD